MNAETKGSPLPAAVPACILGTLREWFCATERGRYALQAVCWTHGRELAAADGDVAVVVTLPEPHNREGVFAVPVAPPTSRSRFVVMDSESDTLRLREIGTPGRLDPTSPVRTPDEMAPPADSARGVATEFVTHKEGQFPNVWQIIDTARSEDDEDVVWLSGRTLRAIGELAHAVQTAVGLTRDLGTVKLRVPRDPGNSVLFEIRWGDSGLTARGVAATVWTDEMSELLEKRKKAAEAEAEKGAGDEG